MDRETAKIFVGCKRPSLIDEYIEGVKDGAREQCLDELKEKVERKRAIAPSMGKGYSSAIRDVLQLIDEINS